MFSECFGIYGPFHCYCDVIGSHDLMDFASEHRSHNTNCTLTGVMFYQLKVNWRLIAQLFQGRYVCNVIKQLMTGYTPITRKS